MVGLLWNLPRRFSVQNLLVSSLPSPIPWGKGRHPPQHEGGWKCVPSQSPHEQIVSELPGAVSSR